MMTLTQAKQTIRRIRAELSTRSNESLQFEMALKLQFKDGLPEEFWELHLLQRRLAQRLLDTRSGVKRARKTRANSGDPTVYTF